tara:strand:+ start:2071 stop:2388 length:318 start_codon:yes stop_codon:yes gene_type:complete
MDGSVDIKLLATIGGIIVSMAGAAAVAKAQIARLTEMLKDVEKRLRDSDSRTDKIENSLSTIKQRLDVIAKMMAPEVMDKNSRLSERHTVKLEYIEAKIEKLKKL